MTLSRKGFEFRERLAVIGVEVTPTQLEDCVDEAAERIVSGPFGICMKCKHSHREDGSRLDFRFGLCDECATASTGEGE